MHEGDGRTALWAGHDVVGGRYALLDVVGEGCAGRVHRALDQRDDRTVALKVALEPWLVGRDRAAGLLRRASAVAAVGHPGLLGALDADAEPERGPYVVSELLDGGSVAGLLEREGALAPHRAAGLVAQAAEALAAAHARGLVHGAVKPANLLLDEDGRVRVADLGWAELRSRTAGDAAWLAPEQCAGRPAGPAADQYALGVVLHELLCGRPPFAGTAADVLAGHLEHAPPEPPARTPASLRDALARALAKDPAERFTDLTAFAAALRACARPAVAPIALPAPPRRRPRLATALAAAGMVLALAAGGLLVVEARDGLVTEPAPEDPTRGFAVAPVDDGAPRLPERPALPTPSPQRRTVRVAAPRRTTRRRPAPRPAPVAAAPSWRTLRTARLDGEGATAAVEVSGARWRLSYTVVQRSCEYAVVACDAPSLDVVGAGGLQRRIALRPGSGVVDGLAGGPGRRDLTLLSTMGRWDVTVTVQELR